jgi:probable O-glycosylation ligase (exosortase A-associated)
VRVALLLVIVAVGIGAAFVSRFSGLLLYLWFAFFRPQEWAWGGIDSLHLSLVIGIIFVVPCLLTGFLPNLTHPLSLVTLGFFLSAVLAQFGAFDWNTGLAGLDMIGRAMLVALLTITLVNTRKRFVAVLLVVAGSLAFHGAKFGVGYLIRGGAQFTAGIGGMFSDNNDFALGLARCLFLLAAGGALQRHRLIKFGVWVALPLNLLAIVSTFSRGGALAVATGGATYLLLHKRRGVALTLVLIGGLAAVSVVPVPQGYLGRMNTLRKGADVEDNSAQGRLHFWQVAAAMAADRPLGVGLNNYPRAYNRYDSSNGAFGSQRAAHSSHFQVLAELGYGGAALWVVLHGGVLWFLWRVRSAAMKSADAETRRFYTVAANALIASEVAFLVGGAFLAQALNDLNWMMVAFTASLDRLFRAEELHQPSHVIDGRASTSGGSSDQRQAVTYA